MPDLRLAVGTVLDWPVDHVAAAVVTADGTVAAATGETDRVFRLASVTKLLTAYAVLIAVEEGAVDWDTPAGPPGSTVRHLAAHASGLVVRPRARSRPSPATRRIYSNVGFDVLGEAVADGDGHAVRRLPARGRLRAAGHGRDHAWTGSPGGRRRVHRRRPGAVRRRAAGPDARPATLDDATRVAFPGLDGVLPGFGRQKPNDWGLGFEIRDGKSPHWTGARSSPRTFGHFGQSGTFLWVDPDAGAACVALTDRDFGPWAIEAWPAWTDGVLAAL